LRCADYIRNVEDELKAVKTKYRQLKEDYDSLVAKGDEVVETGANREVLKEAISGNNLVKAHVERLNQQIGSLRQEKVTTMTVLRKQQTRMEYLEKQLQEMSKAPREKQVALEQLHYKIGAQERQHQVEVSSLKQRVAEAELQAAEARKEAEEYHKACLQSTSEVTALQNELSRLKLDVSEARPMVNFGAQELFIQQLQDEIQNLRQQIQGNEPLLTDLPASHSGQGQVITQLQRKLKAAAKQIKQLSKEKEQLIAMGNRLRATLNNNGKMIQQMLHLYFTSYSVSGIRPPSPKNHQPAHLTKESSEVESTIPNQLQQLELLQYELTKQVCSSSNSVCRSFTSVLAGVGFAASEIKNDSSQ
jgi:chromosome segregation ATPase